MPVPFLATLSLTARMAYPAIVGGVRRGLSANRIQQILVKSGIGIRRSTMLNVIAREKGIIQGGGYLRGLRRGQRFNPLALPEAITSIKRKYAITLELEGTQLDTFLPRTQFITLSMSQPMDRLSMEQLAISIAEAETRERYGIEVGAVRILEGVRAGPAGLL